MSGTSEIEVVWHVYDRLQRKVIHTESTVGRFELKETPAEGAMTFIIGAFSDAARALAQRPGFRNAVAKQTEGSPPVAAAPSGLSQLRLIQAKASAEPLAHQSERVRRATVTIDLGDGHGSGFVIDERGYILTNQHVVGGRERVRVRFLDGTEVTGEVLRRDEVRDVALVKVGGRGHPALPIRPAPAAVAEEVYAIGAPLDPVLSNSVTKGVVSAVRRERNGLVYIQADVNVQQGNSGGPLLDEAGNVVGISVIGLRMGEAMAGINFFIPIHDALERLNLKLVDRPGTS